MTVMNIRPKLKISDKMIFYTKSLPRSSHSMVKKNLLLASNLASLSSILLCLTVKLPTSKQKNIGVRDLKKQQQQNRIVARITMCHLTI